MYCSFQLFSSFCSIHSEKSFPTIYFYFGLVFGSTVKYYTRDIVCHNIYSFHHKNLHIYIKKKEHFLHNCKISLEQFLFTICNRRFRYPSVSRHLFIVCNRGNPSLSFFASPPTTEIVGDSFSLEALGKLALPDYFC